MQYVLIINYSWEYFSDGKPIGVVENITKWTAFQNIAIYQVNTDGTIGECVKKFGIGPYWTDGEFVYEETEEETINIGDLSEDMMQFFQTERLSLR